MGKKVLRLDSFNFHEDNDEVCINEEKISKHDIAIIGISARFPMADNIDEFWDNIRNGVNCVSSFPKSRRIDTDKYLKFKGLQNRCEYMNASYLREIDKFDCNFFNISPKEASLMDPNQRLFLENAMNAIDDAGYGGKLAGSRTGVYVGYKGSLSTIYQRLISDVEPSSLPLSILGNKAPIIASRISYLLNLRGPSMLIETACSSSLVGVHMACNAIRNGDCDLAIAGSIKLMLLPVCESESFGLSENVGVESADGMTRAFDDNSNGTGLGEGVAAILLKPLNKALSDGDNIYAVIKGSAVNQDGKSAGITAPNAIAHEDLILRAWKDAGVDPETIDYIETHGTGTKLGDPIEIDGIERAFRKHTDKKQFCAVGSVKTNIGHLDSAAGMAGIIKAAMALKNKELPPSINFTRPNRNINFIESPVYVNYKLKQWKKEDHPRRCGISSFGLNGTNCHVVLEEAPIHEEYRKYNECGEIFTLSAKSESSLRELIKEYKKYVDVDKFRNLADICYTANTGRQHYNYRIALIAYNYEDFVNKIKSINYIELCRNNKKDIYFGKYNIEEDIQYYIKKKSELNYLANLCIGNYNTKNNHNLKSNCNSNCDSDSHYLIMNEICELYIKGADIKWENIYKNKQAYKINIPVYNFEKRRCWIEVPDIVKLNMNDTHSLIKSGLLSNELSNELKIILDRCKEFLGSINREENSVEVKLLGKEDENYTSMEKLVGQVWKDILGFEEIDIYRNFFELGGDSVIALRTVTRISKKIGIDIKVPQLLRNPSIYKFAKSLEEASSTLGVKEFLDIKPVVKKEYYPASYAQERIFKLEQWGREGINYNMVEVLKANGTLHKEKVEAIFKTLVKRHESFRTSFEMLNGKLVQRIHEDVDFKIQHINSELGKEKEVIKEFIQPFDLSKAPLIRVGIVNLSEKTNLILIDMHHTISDGTSCGILIKEFVKLYCGIELPEISIQYKEFSEWQREFKQSDEFQKQEKFWLNKFSEGIHKLKLPTDFERAGIKNFEGNRVDFSVNSELTNKLNKLAESYETSLYTVLLTSYYILLFKYTGQSEITIGSSVIGRTNKDTENIIGMFANTVLLNNKIQESEMLSDLLISVKNNVIQAIENQDYPIQMFIDKLGTDLVFNTLFVLQNTDIPEIKLNDKELTISPFEYEKNCSKFDITLQAIEKNEEIKLNFEYRIKLFRRKTIEKMVNDYTEILKCITEYGELKISDIIENINYSECFDI